MKTCQKCEEEKDLSAFSIKRSNPDGLQKWCKSCTNEYNHRYSSNPENREKIKKGNKKYYNDNKDRILEQTKEYNHRPEVKIKRREHGIKYKKEYLSIPENLQKRKEYNKKYNKIYNAEYRNDPKNREKIKEYQLQYSSSAEYKERKKEYVRKPENRARKNSRKNERYKNDIQFRLSENLRGRLRKAIKNCQKTGSAVRDLGCTIEEFKVYIEGLFLPGMSWKDWGFGDDKWHLDHIKPIKMFNMEAREELLQVCHYTNIRPLWQKDNLSRKYEEFAESGV